MKKILFAILLTLSFFAEAQVFNNEWIDYNKTYFKFKVGKDGLYRIPQSVLSAAGLGNAPAEHFQLWRNGEQVPIFTSVAAGSLGASDYIEFWGKMNDGNPDRTMYRNTSFHLNNKWSLQTDTAAYFLTISADVSDNLRLETTDNNISGNTLPAEQYFLHTLGQYYKNKINSGFAVNVGENLYSSSYDRGEGWTSSDIVTSYSVTNGFNYGANTLNFSNLFVSPIGPAAKFKIAVSGNTLNQRRFRVNINGDSVLGKSVDFFNASIDSTTFPVSLIGTNSASVVVSNRTMCNGNVCPASDRMVVHFYEITYPRQFNFGAASNFEFTLGESATGKYLEISNFTYGSTPPVLYDLTNMKRYVADLSGAPVLKFVLPASSTPVKFVLVSQQASNIVSVNSLQQKNFINFSNTANQGNYLIISNSVLFQGPGGVNPVEEYRAYRSSVAGGSYNARIYMENELEDQFGFGIKKHPVAIRNFLRFSRMNFATAPQFVFLIGKGVHYVHQRTFESSGPAEQQNLASLNLVPTFGWPGSDVLLSAEPGSSQPQTPIGRLSVISPQEVLVYLQKIKEYELAQKSVSPLIEDKNWTKNVVHIVGASDQQLSNVLNQSMTAFKAIISDTSFGARVSTFSKSSSETVQQLHNSRLQNLFEEGISLITYFGHSSATTLEFNLDNPENYNNFEKYPLFIGLGCNAGNFFNYNPIRFQTLETISEKYVLAQNRGTIGFIASSHFGIVHYLDLWNKNAYRNITSSMYGKTMGEILLKTITDVFAQNTQEDFYARSNAEQTQLHGDPALRLNNHPLADFAVETNLVKVIPNFISVADQSFKVDSRFYNLGRAINSPVVIEVKRTHPNQAVTIYRDTLPHLHIEDSLLIELPVNAASDKGMNKIRVTIDPDNLIDELHESNNSVEKEVLIYEDELRPVYPFNYAIVKTQNIKLTASSANPVGDNQSFKMEIDTTAHFNSPVKQTATTTSMGGIIEFTPGISFTDSTVYYWRVAPVTASDPVWNTFSFIYLPNSDYGFNQSHFYQHLNSTGQRVTMDSATRKWKYNQNINNVFVRNGVYPTTSGQGSFYTGTINDVLGFIGPGCAYDEIIFNVIDPVTIKAWKNDYTGSTGLYQSVLATCDAGREYNFQYFLNTPQWRKKAMDFIDAIPDGHYVVVRSNTNPADNGNTYSSVWKNDEALYGTGNSLYHKFVQQGFADLDSFNRPRSWIFLFKKNAPSEFLSKTSMSVGIYDPITLDADCNSTDTLGYITSPSFGPAKQWKQVKWRGVTGDNLPGDLYSLDVIGVKENGEQTILYENLGTQFQDMSLSTVNAEQFPYIRLKLRTQDSINFTPYQLGYWRLTYVPSPEGGLSPNILYTKKDTVEIAEPLNFKVVFKNISDAAFDSLKVKMVVTDANNQQHTLPVPRHRNLPVGDTVHINYSIDTRKFAGANSLYVEVNPDNDQPEQYHYNNFIYTNFFVRPDTLQPLMDVTFDNVRILNRDIVSAKPHIVIRLMDEAKWYTLTDTSTLSVQVRYPDNTTRNFSFDGNIMQFVPAQTAPSTDNTAVVNLRPHFDQDGDYELMVTGKDMSHNSAGNLQYKVGFQVINKPMISNMLNYPNPFTTSTAFVFTVTGSEVPQNIRIQILTVTGKVVREITKEELGPIHIGRNITEYKWDGTDQYGQKLANGIYLYRVITNLNGNSLEKYKGPDDNTDKYFNKGYGKMVLIR